MEGWQIILSSTVLVSIVEGIKEAIAWRRKRKAEKNKRRRKNNFTAEERKAIKDGLQCLLRAEIIRSYEKYLDKGYCPVYAKESLKRGYNAYHQLDGNDVATDLFRRVMALPTEPDKEEK